MKYYGKTKKWKNLGQISGKENSCHETWWKRLPKLKVGGQVLRVSLTIKCREIKPVAENMYWQDDGLDELMHFPSLTSMIL